MSVGTAIEWTHIPGTVPATMNALVGCRKVSRGCKHCYAITTANLRAGNPLQLMQEKFGGTTERTGAGLNWTGKVTLSEKALLEPLTKRKPHTYFVNSMSDLFYEGVRDEWIDRHYAVFALCPQHTFIVLTKRPERMQKYLSSSQAEVQTRSQAAIKWVLRSLEWSDASGMVAYGRLLSGPLPNVWHLVSVEDQKSADERIPLLLQTPSAVRGVSCEPLLGPVVLSRRVHTPGDEACGECGSEWARQDFLDAHMYCTGESVDGERCYACGEALALPRLDWVICGGESGAGARPMHPDWARGLRDQCQAAGVPFFFKQWGDLAPGAQSADYASAKRMFTRIDIEGKPSNDPTKWNANDALFYRVGKKAAGHLLDGREWHQFPEGRA